ncbi:CRPV-396 [Crowpox virus]|nr:CRPV-396 [Crowpox virus]
MFSKVEGLALFLENVSFFEVHRYPSGSKNLFFRTTAAV